MNKTDEAMRDQLTAILQAGVSESAIEALKKQVREIIYDVESDIEYRLKDEMAPNLSAWVADLAERAVEQLLAGNEDQMRRYLSCEKSGSYTGRSTGAHWGNRDIAQEHPIIHGKLFETGCIELRKKIVDAHRDLLVSERILDLEDQVKSLVAQVNKADREREAMRGMGGEHA